jgi:hypothetical protein
VGAPVRRLLTSQQRLDRARRPRREEVVMSGRKREHAEKRQTHDARPVDPKRPEERLRERAHEEPRPPIGGRREEPLDEQNERPLPDGTWTPALSRCGKI